MSSQTDNPNLGPIAAGGIRTIFIRIVFFPSFARRSFFLLKQIHYFFWPVHHHYFSNIMNASFFFVFGRQCIIWVFLRVLSTRILDRHFYTKIHAEDIIFQLWQGLSQIVRACLGEFISTLTLSVLHKSSHCNVKLFYKHMLK